MEKRLTKEEFLKDLWHPNTEEPDKSKSDIITLGFDNDAYIQLRIHSLERGILETFD